MKGRASTSRMAYRDLVESGSIVGWKLAVVGGLRAIGASTCNELAEHMGCHPNYLTGRLVELEELGIVERNGKRVSSVTGKLNHVWRLVA